VEWIEPFAAEVAEELDGGGGGGVEEDGDGGDRFVGLFFFSPPAFFLFWSQAFSLLKKKAQDVGFVFLI
jgi:hypothetical protein